MWYRYISQLYSSIFDIMLWRDNTCEFALNCYRRLKLFPGQHQNVNLPALKFQSCITCFQTRGCYLLRNVVRKKTWLCGKNSQVADPPSPLPQFGKPLLSKKKVGFIFHFRTSGTFLVFTKKSPFWVIDWNYVVGIGEPPLRDARFLHFPQKENIVKC